MADAKPSAGWSVRLSPGPTSMLAEVLSCMQIWSWLTRAQRQAVADASGGRLVAHPRTVENLRRRGLVDGEGKLTAVGALVAKWNRKEESGG